VMEGDGGWCCLCWQVSCVGMSRDAGSRGLESQSWGARAGPRREREGQRRVSVAALVSLVGHFVGEACGVHEGRRQGRSLWEGKSGSCKPGVVALKRPVSMLGEALNFCPSCEGEGVSWLLSTRVGCRGQMVWPLLASAEWLLLSRGLGEEGWLHDRQVLL
jgi:hypothetical protein